MIKFAYLLMSAAVAASVSDSAYISEERYSGISVSEYGNIMLIDELDLLDSSEEKNIYFTIVEAVKAKDISIGVVSTSDTSEATAEQYYNQISDSDSDFALMLFNETEYSYHFYGTAEAEFEKDDDAFWMTDSYISEHLYFIAGVQFPLDIQYHVISEYDYTVTPEETTSSSSEFPENYFTEIAKNGIHTASLENGYTALLHDIDNSLTEAEEAQVLTDLMGAVRETDFNIGIVITNDIGDDKSDYGVRDFTDLYYEEYCGMNTDGILLLINNDNKYDWISTSGRCIDIFYGKEDGLFDSMYDFLVSGNYELACQSFVQNVKYYGIKAGYDYDDDYDYDYDDDGYHVHIDGDDIGAGFSFIVFAIFIAIIAVSIFAGVITNSYKMKKNVSAENYKLQNSLAFSQQTDTYIRTYTTRRTVSSSSSRSRSGRSGGSRSHRSSSGGRHGGGGRRR